MGQWTPSYVAKEVHGTRTETWNDNNSTANVTVQVDYNDRLGFVNEILAKKAYYPWALGPILLRCTSARIRTEKTLYTSSDGETIDYNHYVLIDLTYTYLKGILYDQEDPSKVNWYTEEDYKPTTDYLDADYSYFTYADDAYNADGTVVTGANYDPANEALKQGMSPGIPWPSATLRRTVWGYSTATVKEFAEYIDTVNAADYESDHSKIIYKAGTLLADDVNMEFVPYTGGAASGVYKVTIEYNWKRYGHNRLPRTVCVNDVPRLVFDGVKRKQCNDQAPDDTIFFESKNMQNFLFTSMSLPS